MKQNKAAEKLWQVHVVWSFQVVLLSIYGAAFQSYPELAFVFFSLLFPLSSFSPQAIILQLFSETSHRRIS